MLSDQLNSWLHAHKNEFIAYSVTDKSIDTILSASQVKPQEQQIRDINLLTEEQVQSGSEITKKVSCFIARIKRENKTFAPIVAIGTGATISFLQAYQLGFVNEDVLDILAQNKPDSMIRKLSNGHEILLKRAREGNPFNAYDVVLSGVSWGKYDYNDTERLTSYTFHEQVAIDSLAAEPIDVRLSKIWDTYKELCNKPRLFHELLSFRERELYYSCNGKELTTTFNAIPWNHGEVFILRGNPRDILSVSNQTKHRMDFDSKSERILTKGEGVNLLCPFENKGKALVLALSQVDTIVLGPQAILEPYASSFHERNICFCTFEAMTSAQLDLLEMPLNLRPQVTDGGSISTPEDMKQKQMDALNTITFFAQKQLKMAFDVWRSAEEQEYKP